MVLTYPCAVQRRGLAAGGCLPSVGRGGSPARDPLGWWRRPAAGGERRPGTAGARAWLARVGRDVRWGPRGGRWGRANQGGFLVIFFSAETMPLEPWAILAVCPYSLPISFIFQYLFIYSVYSRRCSAWERKGKVSSLVAARRVGALPPTVVPAIRAHLQQHLFFTPSSARPHQVLILFPFANTVKNNIILPSYIFLHVYTW